MKLDQLYIDLKASMSDADALYVLKKRLGVSHADLISDPNRVVDSEIVLEDLARVQAGEPLSRIYGEREFYGHVFTLNEATLDPRIDTETLIDLVLERYRDAPPRMILDIGTGSGCILLTLLKAFPEARGVAVDLSYRALEAAKQNARRLGVENRALFAQGDLAESLGGDFDLVVSNPPYIESKVIPELDENVQKYDPILALDGGEDGLDAYKKMFSRLSEIIKIGGSVFFEIGFNQSESVMRLSKDSWFSNVQTFADSSGNPRVVEIFFDPSVGISEKK